MIAARIKTVPGRMTLYASSGDEALRASQRLAGYPRAGQGGAGIVVVAGIDTVDASLVDTSLLGLRHSVLRRQPNDRVGPFLLASRACAAGPRSVTKKDAPIRCILGVYASRAIADEAARTSHRVRASRKRSE